MAPVPENAVINPYLVGKSRNKNSLENMFIDEEIS
jgi:hypothetical protein